MQMRSKSDRLEQVLGDIHDLASDLLTSDREVGSIIIATHLVDIRDGRYNRDVYHG